MHSTQKIMSSQFNNRALVPTQINMKSLQDYDSGIVVGYSQHPRYLQRMDHPEKRPSDNIESP
jgi:hypothetical protein